MSSNKIKIVEIEWIDSCSSRGWASKEHHIGDFSVSSCRSTGYVIEKTKDIITLAQSLGDDTKNIADTISIPLVAVKKIRTLK